MLAEARPRKNGRPSSIVSLLRLGRQEEMSQRRPEFYGTNDIPGSRPNTQNCIGKSGRHTDPLNPSYVLPHPKQAPAKPPKFIRDAMDVSDIVGARPATVGSGLRVFRGGSMVVDWTRANQEGKKDSQASRPPTGTSSNADIEGAQPLKHAIYRAGSKCDWTRARAAETNERGGSNRGRDKEGSDGQLGPSRIASAIQQYVVDPSVSPAGSPSRKHLHKPRPGTAGETAKTPPKTTEPSKERPKSNTVEGDGSFDIFGRPCRSNSTPMASSTVNEAPGKKEGVRKGGGARAWTCPQLCAWVEGLDFGDSGASYLDAFRKLGVDGSLLDALDDETLENEVGVKFSLHRRKILSKVKGLLEQ